jgi:hypothetical protein
VVISFPGWSHPGNAVHVSKQAQEALVNFRLKVAASTILLISSVANADQTEHFPRHHLAFFVCGGIEKEHGHSESGYALGLEYEFRFNAKWGLGIDLEKLFGNETDRSGIVALPLSFHPSENWRFFLGPGYESHDKKDKFLIRTGIAYEWELKNGWSLSPEFIADFLDGGAKTYVAGIAIGHGF